jgi:hypothetical protein
MPRAGDSNEISWVKSWVDRAERLWAATRISAQRPSTGSRRRPSLAPIDIVLAAVREPAIPDAGRRDYRILFEDTSLGEFNMSAL